ncbi:MAG: hypothetical protein FJ225_07225 [Lentisphaerae bacterium]|nr:hypothetical protein [Lentisphaerota bacterium]
MGRRSRNPRMAATFLLPGAAARTVAALLFAAPPARAGEPVDAPALPEVLTLDAALTHAWRHHPAVTEARERAAGSRGIRAQAGLWPRPELDLGVFRKPAEDESEVALSQTIELGGKRAARAGASDAAIATAAAGVAEAWSEVRAGVGEAFAQLDYLRAAADLRGRLAAAEREMADLAASLRAAGKLSEAAELGFRQAAAAAGATAEGAAAEAADAERRVFTAIGVMPPPSPVRIECGPAFALLDGAEFDALLCMALTNNPALNTARAAAAAARAEERLERARRWMDLRVAGAARQIEARRPDGTSGAGLGGQVGVDLPLWDRNQGNVTAARHAARAAEATARSAEVETAAAVSRLLAAHRGNRALAEAYDREIVPLALRRDELAAGAAEAGRASAIERLDARRGLLAATLEQARAVLMARLSAIQLERLLQANPPPGIRERGAAPERGGRDAAGP